MKLITYKSDEFKVIFNAVSELIDEANLTVSKDGLRIFEPDAAMVVMVKSIFKPEYFEIFEVPEEEKIGINLHNFMDILKLHNKEKLEITRDGTKLAIRFLDNNRRFTIPILNITETAKPETASLEFKTVAEMPTKELKVAVTDADTLTDSLIFNFENNMMNFEAESDVSTYKKEVNSDDLIIRKAENSRSRYPVDYLKKILKAEKIFETVCINFGTDYPAKFDFKNGGKLELSYLLAPRVPEE